MSSRCRAAPLRHPTLRNAHLAQPADERAMRVLHAPSRPGDRGRLMPPCHSASFKDKHAVVPVCSVVIVGEWSWTIGARASVPYCFRHYMRTNADTVIIL